jgi:hypothetical protein
MGVDLSLGAVCGAVEDCAVEAYFDNIVLTSGTNPGTAPEPEPPVVPPTGDNLGSEGDFEAGFASWATTGDVTIEDGAVKLLAASAGQSSIKLTGIGAGILTAGQVVTVSFDVKGSANVGGVVNGIIHTVSSANAVVDTDEIPMPTLTAEWVRHSVEITLGSDAGMGVDLSLGAVCGAVEDCAVEAYFDNIVLTSGTNPDTDPGTDPGTDPNTSLVDLLKNGEFSGTDIAPWSTFGAVTLEDGAVKMLTASSGQSSIKQTGIGAGMLTAGQVVTVSFDLKGSLTDGGVVNGIVHTVSSANAVVNTDEISIPAPTAEWETHSVDINIGSDAGMGVDLSFGAVCGAVEDCAVEAYFDNIRLSAWVETIEDIQAPVITLVGDDLVYVLTGDTYTDAGVTITDNVDSNLVATVAGDEILTSVEGDYITTYDVTDATGNDAVQVTRTVTVSSTDMVAPVITLLGLPSLTLSLNEDYIEQGATAADNVDGTITENIIIDESAIDTSAVGTYTVTYMVRDAAGNEAVKVTRQINVIDPSNNILTNGNFATALGAEWVIQEGLADINIVNAELSVTNLAPGVANWQPRLVQTGVDLMPSVTYAIRFDAMVAEQRSILVQLGEQLSSDPWFNEFMDDKTVALTTSMDSYEVIFTANANAVNPGSLIFALGSGVATDVTFDNISIREITAAEIPPAITLLGDSAVSLTVGGAYTDAGATAFDNLEGDVTENIVTTGDANVDVDTLGVYTITYNVMDNDGNAANQVTRTVSVKEEISGPVGTIPTDSEIVNGDFATGNLDGWAVNTVPGGTAEAEQMAGNWSAKLAAADTQSAIISQSSIGAGTFTTGQEVTVAYAMRGTSSEGGVAHVVLSEVYLTTTSPTDEWQYYSHDVTVGAAGLSLSLLAECGAVASCEVTVYFDNVSIVAN